MLLTDPKIMNHKVKVDFSNCKQYYKTEGRSSGDSYLNVIPYTSFPKTMWVAQTFSDLLK